MTSFNARRVRADIPQLYAVVNGRPITYLDSGASSLQPTRVIVAMSRYYELRHANVHRGVYTTANEATEAYEGARAAVGRFINAPGGANEIVFTKNTTESMNLVARTWGAANLGEGDVVLVTEMEHHANIVPWFQLREATGVEVRFIPVGDDYRLDLTNLDELLDGVKLLSVTGMSNVLGTKNPVRELADAAHRVGALDRGRRRPDRSPTVPSTSPRSTSTFSPSPATRCSGPPASACSGRERASLTPWGPSWAAAA